MMHPRFPIYIVPRPDHYFMVGATTLENEDTERTTVRSLLELLSAAYALHPSFGEAALIETNAGARPAFPDHLPSLAWTQGLLHINGLYRHGFLISPALAEEIVHFLEQGSPSEEHASIWSEIN
jgi:glycine oxidase